MWRYLAIVNHFQAAIADPGLSPGNEAGYTTSLPAAHVVEFMPGVIYRDAALTVNAFEVTHETPASYGFRVHTADRTIVISGDTRPRDTVVDACNGCDLLFHEVFGLRFEPTGPTDPANGHTSAEELGELARRAHPKKLVIYHDVRAPHDETLAVIRKSFNGDVAFARDLDMF